MKKSLRARRMERHHSRMKKDSSLNLTSLMDIFTILVFFLMVNSSDVQVLKDTKSLIMPKSVAEQKPKDTLVIMVDNQSVTIQGQVVASLDQVKFAEEDIIPALDDELKRQAARRPELTEEEKLLGRPITIQGDKEIPYVVLKKLMATCAQAEYRDISLAVTRMLKKQTGGE